ncbi:unnamed protein product [Nezara viridula]|uniref:G-protein coupled receptors family 1 profile domain-containing protein n=1 Tax=Nezara viridula TaxID=85310 RepID=A0A9P0HHW0_NEZVI|nr:unnamed protein product [Nezara viridula]
MNCSNSSSGCPEGGELYEPLYEPPTYLTVFLSICYISISVAAVVGNGLVIWVILTSRRMRNVTNYYIANLALADIAVGLFAIPFETLRKINSDESLEMRRERRFSSKCKDGWLLSRCWSLVRPLKLLFTRKRSHRGAS